ncbi:SRPBCC family protein [Actinokineospora bangkokensis]|uniref:Polyketide cyclase n=1 Tax=Actinokineospora bangkokensis TaxID=1193682 RepID=A0A1Q9LND2_9PSEU|nr:SRPBCC family protein [Actinokineospora bangkokensis]OLR93525.1 polyketide cyclase [Actinokineospora bangkokensis]
MVQVSRTFTVAKPLPEVGAYLSDFSNAVEWDPGTESCERMESGPVRVGARWHNTSKIAGVETELVYELEELTPELIRFVGRNKTATSTDEITLAEGEAAGTTRITYQATIEFHGAAKLASPIAKAVFEKVGSDTEDSLKRVLGAVHA